MTKRSLTLLLLLTSLQPLVAQHHDAAPPDVRGILRALEEMQAKNAASVQHHLRQVLQEVTQAGGGRSAASSLYEKAIRATQFSGRNSGEFQEWKKNNADRLRDEAFQTAVSFHLQYLGLTLRRALGATTEELLPELVKYSENVLKVLADKDLRPKVQGQEFFRASVLNSIFTNWYQITPHISGMKEWEPSAGNLNGIYQQTILPVLRQKKDPALLRYWDTRIAFEEKAHAESRQAFEMEQFANVGKPNLLWARAQEVLILGQRNHAVNEMFALIKKYPDHPNNAAWIAHLQKLLAPQPTPAGS